MGIPQCCVAPLLEITGRSMCTIHSPQHAWQTGTMQPRCNRAHSSIQPPFFPSLFLPAEHDGCNDAAAGPLTSPAVSEGGSDNWHRPLLMSQVLSPTQYYCIYQDALRGTNCGKFSNLCTAVHCSKSSRRSGIIVWRGLGGVSANVTALSTNTSSSNY